MGVLAPFFLAGMTALALPLIFHLVRRTPQGRQEFSSLMFLSPSPPRLTKRTRLDQILLLLMRLAALTLLACAFARPFWREAALISLNDLPPRRVALLVDTSASMQRGDLWKQAQAQIDQELQNLAPQDQVALYTFGDRLQTVVSFPDGTTSAAGAAPAAAVEQQVRQLQPGWGVSDLGTALVTLASELDAAHDVLQSHADPQIVLISDYQQGNRLEALQSYEWPKRVQLVTRVLTPREPTNAQASLLPVTEEEPDVVRVRVMNAANSTGDQFFVSWRGGKSSPAVSEVSVYVPPGQSRVVRLPRPENNLQADRIELRGDAHPFDNTFYVVPPRQQEVTVLYAGSDEADDPQGLRYYLGLVLAGDPLRKVELQAWDGKDDTPLRGPLPPKLVVVSRPLAESAVEPLKAHVERGGTLLLVAADPAGAPLLTTFFEDVQLPESPAERKEGDFLLLGEIDFSHPLFAPFANPRYNDFTKIHFWQNRPVTMKTPAVTHVAARFDNGTPWLLERPIGTGRILALTSGWQPDESQLAVSSKFVPLMGGLLDLAMGGVETISGAVVQTAIPLPEKRTGPLTVRTPQERVINVPPGEKTFSQTAEPGIYRVGSGSEEWMFAVNLAASESDTAPLELEQFGQSGVRLSPELTRAEELNKIRQQRDTELESRQRLWQWLLVCCLGLLVVESWWAGRTGRVGVAEQEVLA